MPNLLGPTEEERDLGQALSQFGEKLRRGIKLIQHRAFGSLESVPDLPISETQQELVTEARDLAKRLDVFAEGFEKTNRKPI